MVGIILALDYEIDNSILKKLEYETLNNQKFYFNDDLVITFSGVGKVNATLAISNLINNFVIDEIYNIGSCGSANKNIEIKDVILINNSQYGDVDVSIDPKYKINQIPYEPKLFTSNPKINKFLSSILEKLNINYKVGDFATVDSFVTKQNFLKFNEIESSNILGIDMELVAIAQTCYHYNLPFGAIKIVTDNVKSNNNHDDFEKNVKEISIITKNIVNEILRKLI